MIEAETVTLGERIRQRRNELGLGLVDAAARCGISKSHIDDLEKGRSANPTVGTLYAIAQGLRLPLTELVRLALDAELSTEFLAGQVVDLLSALPEQDRAEILDVLEAMARARAKRLGT